MRIKDEVVKLKEIVEKILRDDERCRNDDKWLIIQTLRALGFNLYIDYKDLSRMPSFESITRCRRKIQEDKYKANSLTQQKREANRQEMSEINKW